MKDEDDDDEENEERERESLRGDRRMQIVKYLRLRELIETTVDR